MLVQGKYLLLTVSLNEQSLDPPDKNMVYPVTFHAEVTPRSTERFTIMAQRFPFRAAIAGLTAIAIAAAPISTLNNPLTTAAVAQALDAASTQETLPIPGWVTVQPKAAGKESVFTATVPTNTQGTVLFEVKDKNAANQEGTAEWGIMQTPIENGKATLRLGIPKAGEYTVQATVLDGDKAGKPSAAYSFTVPEKDRTGGSSINGNVEAADIAGPIVGAVLSLAILIGSQTHIPAIQQVITDTQKAMGIYNPSIAATINNALPVAGGAVGLGGLIAAIVELVKAIKASNVDITVTPTGA